MKPIIFLLIFILVASSVFAIDCNSLNNKELCQEIVDSDLSSLDKDYLISDIISDLKNFPSHDLVREWNLDIDTSQAPDDVEKHNQGYIRNAWVKLLAVMPSVLENDTLLCSDSGEVLSAFDHDISIPSGTMRGDCRTEYNLKENTGVLNVFVNDDFVSSGRLVSFNTSEDSVFKSEYDVTVRTDIKHYQWRRYCCLRKGGSCSVWCKKCEYKYTENKVDNLKISESLSAQYYNPETTANFSVIDIYLGTTKGILSAENHTSVQLSFENSYFNEFNYFYSTIWNITPYNVLTVRADKKERIEFNNLFFEKNEIVLSDVSECQIQVNNHFKNLTLPCDLDFERLNISIKTAKFAYDPEEEINIKIEPSDILFNVSYANETFTAKGSLSINAVYPYNRISIIHNGRRYDALIHVKNKNPLNVLFSLSIFGGFNYVIIGFVRKFWGVIP